MRIGAIIQWLAGGLVAGAMLYTGAHGYFSAARKQVQTMRAEDAMRVSRQWSRQAQEQEEERQHTLTQRKRELDNQWQEALGGAVEAASKDPSLSISQMIEATARTCAAPEDKVSVTVERFTEFTLDIELSAGSTEAEIVRLAACLLPYCGTYLQRIRFSRGGDILAEFGPGVLAGVKDWRGMKPQTVSAMLAARTREVRLASVMNVSHGATDLSPDEHKLQTAEEDFYDLVAGHFGLCRQLIRQQDTAVNLASIRSAAELEARIKGLEEAQPRLEKAQAFFEKPETEYEGILRKTGFDSLVVQVTTRGYLEANRMQNAHLLFIFDKLLERQAATMKLLETMRTSFGQWSPTPDGRIQFQTKQLQATYESVLEDYNSATRVLDQALKAMPSKGK